LFSGQRALAQQIISVDFEGVIVCPADPDINQPPSFLGEDCFTTQATNIDPQNKALWIKAQLSIPQEMREDNQPHSVYISGKASSRIYFNGQLIGENGVPSINKQGEIPGKIDAMFYVQPKLIQDDANELVILLSSHHGFLALKNPINFVGFGIYADPSYFIQRNIWQSFIPLGALFLAILYFAVSCFSPHQRRTNGLFLLMSFFAGTQLLAELSRALFSYSYPLQDIRLMAIVLLSMSFGFCLLYYVATKFLTHHIVSWLVAGLIATIIAVTLVPNFDPKTAIAIFIPCLFSIAIIGSQLYQRRTSELIWFLLVFVLLVVTILLTLNQFHDVVYYYLVTGVLCYLFIQQALNYSKERNKRKEEQKRVEKLQFILEQKEQKTKPNTIKITSAGKIDVITTDTIAYCKAAGDYVEIYLVENKQILFSGNLKELEKQLPTTFLRVHRSYIVNMDTIVLLKSSASNNKSSSGSGLLVLNDGNEVPVSRRIMPSVRSAIVC